MTHQPDQILENNLVEQMYDEEERIVAKNVCVNHCL